MSGLHIIELRERPEFADTCAAWDYAEWGCHMPKASLQDACEGFAAIAKNLAKATVWLALADNKPVGMVTLTDDDHPDRKDLSPWLSALYVHPKFRLSGIGNALCRHLIAVASERGYGSIYLYTATAESLYEKLGWQPIGIVQGPTGLDETLMARRTGA